MERTAFERNFAGMRFEHPIMNGPGWACKSVEEIAVLTASQSSGIMVGAITKQPRLGNPADNSFFDIPYLSSNSLGMPNRGLPYYRDEEALYRMVELAHKAGKPLGVNVAAIKSPGELIELAEFVEECGADWVQLNLSCPNVHDNRGKGRLYCEDVDYTYGIVLDVMKEVSIPVDAKLSPFSFPSQRMEMAHAMKDAEVPIVTLCNTFPSVLVYRNDLRPAIYSKLPDSTITKGGMGGPAMKPIALAHVELFRSILHPWQKIIGIGGVESGQDVIEYETAGAEIVQLTTAHAVRGTKVFDQICSKYVMLKTKDE